MNYMRTALLTGLLLLIALPLQAKLLDEFGEVIKGEGPKERYTREQLLPYALKVIPGILIEESSSWQNDDFYHEFVIQQEDGSIYELEYYAISGALYEIEVEKLAENAVLPPKMIDEEKAKLIAVNLIQNNTKGKLKAKLKKISIGQYGRKLAYTALVRKGTKYYEVIIDAFSEKILEMERE